MYADRYAKQKKLDPGSLGLSALLVGGIMAGMVFSAPNIGTVLKDPRLIIRNIELTPPPPPDPKPLPQKPEVQQPNTRTQIVPPPQHVTIDKPEAFVVNPGPKAVEITEGTGTGIGGGGGEILTKPAPVVVDAVVDPRYAANYQPEYPSSERRLGNEGRVVVKVLIGTDGRVKQVEMVSSPSSSFFEATRRRALEKWRFKPGTRDGVPMETWKTMAVRFVMTEE